MAMLVSIAVGRDMTELLAPDEDSQSSGGFFKLLRSDVAALLLVWLAHTSLPKSSSQVS